MLFVECHKRVPLFTYLICMLLVVVMIDMPYAQRVHWNVKTKPMVIGEDLELFCNTSLESQYCHGCPMIWSGWSGNRIINLNNYSYVPHKFEVASENEGFLLRIKKISKSDVLHKYTCSFGFESYTSTIVADMTDDNLIICFPEKNETKVYYNNVTRKIEGKVVLEEVSPLPKCEVKINGDEILARLIPQENESKPWSNATIDLEYPLNDTLCHDSLLVEMTCLFAGRRLSIFNKTIIMDCTEHSGETKHLSFFKTTAVMFVLLFVIAVMVGLIIFLKKWKFKSSSHAPQKRKENENENERCIAAKHINTYRPVDSSKGEIFELESSMSSKQKKNIENNYQQTRKSNWRKRLQNFLSKTDKSRKRKIRKTLRNANGQARNREKDTEEESVICCDETGNLDCIVQVVFPLTNPARPQVADRG